MFEHCSLCFRVRMTAALKRRHLQETVVLDDDTDTMISLVGRRVIPILVKDDGEPMLESMDMVKHIEAMGEPVLTGPERPEIADWAEGFVSKAAPLTMPRYPLLGLPEFATVAALDHYTVRKRKLFGDLTEVRARTRQYISQLMPDLEALDRMIGSPNAVNGSLSIDDVRVLPLLRSAAVVQGLRFPDRVRTYFETMMARTGYRPLPQFREKRGGVLAFILAQSIGLLNGCSVAAPRILFDERVSSAEQGLILLRFCAQQKAPAECRPGR